MTKKLPRDQIKYPRINENDRHLIEHMWNDEKLTQSEIARKLNRSQSAISRELKQGNIFDFSNLSKRQLYNLEIHSRIKYSALRGQFIATQRSVRRGNGSKLLTDELKELIEHWVNVEHWTPEQIAEAHVSDIEVSASTIRNWARQGKIYLRPYYRKRANNTDAEKVKIKTQYQKQREIDRLRSKLKSQGILVRHSIYERPPKINTRRQFGHWEIDLVLPAKGKNGGINDKSAILTLVERKTRFYVLVKIDSKQSFDVIKGFRYFYKNYGKWVRTITADNGIEFMSWDFLEVVQQEYKTKIYYATPSSPQERGTNEYKNRELRVFIPKKTTFRTIKQKDLEVIADKINRKPIRIALQGSTPYERFNKEYRNMERYKERYIKQKIKKYEQKLAEEINALKDVNLTDIDADKDVKVDIDDIS